MIDKPDTMQTVQDTSTTPPDQVGTQRPRAIALRTRGDQHGPIRRLVSPSTLGQLIKPFVFLDLFDIDTPSPFRFNLHPHSGVATLTLLKEGGFSYEDSTGASGTLHAGAVEWMQAGNGVMHQGESFERRTKGYQLWVALPPDLENAPAKSVYLHADRFAQHGPARVILGELGGALGAIQVPSPMNVLDVKLRRGEHWRYEPPTGHDVAWIAVQDGAVQVPDAVYAGELVVFEMGEIGIDLHANAESCFMLASAPRHAYDLALGKYSVHTTPAALKLGEDGIRRIFDVMRADAEGHPNSRQLGQHP